MGIRKLFGNLFFKISKWDLVVEQSIPQNGAVLVGAPHTSNWDFILMLAISGKTGMKYKWLGKSSLFKGPAGPIMRGLGGFPVDRKNSHGLVEKMAEQMRSNPGCVLAITPEGTRSLTEYWKSGFYRISKETSMPMLLCFVDSATNTTGLGPLIYPTDDVEADMDKIRAFYDGKVGIHPELTGVPRLKAEDSAMGEH